MRDRDYLLRKRPIDRVKSEWRTQEVRMNESKERMIEEEWMHENTLTSEGHERLDRYEEKTKSIENYSRRRSKTKNI